nr:MAG TPA: hypothetical protein [Caudoviricetes sp.]
MQNIKLPIRLFAYYLNNTYFCSIKLSLNEN